MDMKKNASGLPVDENGLTEAEFLAGYDMTKYPRPSVTVDAAVLDFSREEPRILLIKRRNHPFIGKWALPGGFINMDEDLEAAARRELMEETGVGAAEMRQIGAYGRADRDPRGRIITVAYLMRLPEGTEPLAGDDAADAGMFSVEVDEAAGVINLTCPEKAAELMIPYCVRDGRAVYPGETALAGDHSQVLADALIIAGIINA